MKNNMNGTPNRTFGFIKPHAMDRALEILMHIINATGKEAASEIKVAQVGLVTVSRELAEEHYKEHEGKPFFEKIVSELVGNAVMHYVLECANSEIDVAVWLRTLTGATKVQEASEGTLRKIYGDPTEPSKNAVHASANLDDAFREINLWCPDLLLKN
jgi:nucleoside-diphosphate kinase